MRLTDLAFNPPHHNRWYIWGMPLSGKTSLGKKLKKRLPFNVFDLDAEIEKTVGKSIAEIFASSGEVAFRNMEREMLHTITENNNEFLLVVGGGTPCVGNNAEFMLQNGNCLFMHTSLDEILKRSQSSGGRPLIVNNPTEKLIQLYNERLPVYQQANAVFYSEKEALEYFDIVVS